MCENYDISSGNGASLLAANKCQFPIQYNQNYAV